MVESSLYPILILNQLQKRFTFKWHSRGPAGLQFQIEIAFIKSKAKNSKARFLKMGRTLPHFVYFRSLYIPIQITNID